MFKVPNRNATRIPGFALAGSLLLAGHTHAETFTVEIFQNVQAVINNAVDGDTIVFMPGEFQQIINVNGKALTLRSSDPDDPAVVNATIINAVGLDSAITVTSVGATPMIIDGLTITGGDSPAGGGGIYADGASELHVRNCIVTGNTAVNPGGGMQVANTSQLFIDGSTFSGNEVTGTGSDGGGLYMFAGTALVTNSTFVGNMSVDSGAGARFDSVTTQLTSCTFETNDAGNNGGALFIRSGTVLTVDACRFVDNTATWGGAGYVWDDAGSATFRNSIFQGNQVAGNGGALFNADVLTVVNCTFDANTPNAIEGNSSPSTKVYNSVVWNSGTIHATAVVRNSIVEGGHAGGINILDADPMFVNALAGMLALQPGSPAIDAGSTSLYTGPLADFDGNIRGIEDPDSFSELGESVFGPIIDIGAYEHQVDAAPDTCPTDITNDGVTNINDLLNLLGGWGSCDA